MPMQPSPIADTVKPLVPSCRCFMRRLQVATRSSQSYPFSRLRGLRAFVVWTGLGVAAGAEQIVGRRQDDSPEPFGVRGRERVDERADGLRGGRRPVAP